MATPVSHSTSVPNGTTTTTPASSLSVPIGIAAQPTALSSAITTPEDTGVWQTVVEYCETFGDFLRRLMLDTLLALRSALGAAIGWFGGESEKNALTSGARWQLPTTSYPIHPATSGVTIDNHEDHFSQLLITPAEQQKIYTVVHAIGGSWFSLMRQQGTVRRYGDEIHHVHPLKFLEFAFRHPDLPADLDSCSRSALTWNPFIAGLSEKLRRLHATLPQCITGFARALNVNRNDLEPFFSQPNWEAMVKFLIDVKLGRRTSVWIEPSPTTNTVVSETSAVVALAPAVTAARSASTMVNAADLTPAQIGRIADLPFEADDERILNDLIKKYDEYSLWRLGWEHNALKAQWAQISGRNPLKLLVLLRSKPELMTMIHNIFQHRLIKTIFLRALKHHVARASYVTIRPYIDEFAQISLLDSESAREQFSSGNWQDLIEDWYRTYRRNAV